MTPLTYGLVGVAAVEFAGRQIARASLLSSFGIGEDAGARALLVLVGLSAAVEGWRLIRRESFDALVRLLLAAGLVFGLYAQLQLGARLQSDGFYYFAYLRSLAFDRDVDFTNDYKLLGLGDKAHLFAPTPTGYAQSTWTIGPAIAWAPFYAGGHLVARTLQASRTDVPLDGTSFPYRQSVCLAGLVYGLLGWWFCYRLTTVWFTPGRAAAAVAVMALGSFMLWYTVKEPSMTHAPSMAAVAAFTYGWAKTIGDRSYRRWLLLGLAVGLMSNIRWQNAIFALMPATEIVADLWRSRRIDGLRQLLVLSALACVAASVGFLPQMIAWKSIYGSYLAVSPLGPQIRWWAPHLVDILWSSRNGLLATSPVIYAAAIGLLILTVTEWRRTLPLVVPVVVMVFFNASIQDWWGSSSFGMRRFDGILPMLTVGLAAFIGGLDTLVRRRPHAVIAACLTVIVVWNLTLMKAATLGVIGSGDAVSFGSVGAAQARAAHQWFGHPFSWPINLLYAAWNGVSPGDYDRLSGHRFLGDPGRPYGKVDVGLDDAELLIGGWHQPERSGDLTFRWARRAATLRVPLDHAAPLKVQLRLRPFLPPGQAAMTVNVTINGRTFGPFQAADGWQTVEFVAPAEAWRTGLNQLALESSVEQSPRSALGVADDRMLSIAVDYLRVQIDGT